MHLREWLLAGKPETVPASDVPMFAWHDVGSFGHWTIVTRVGVFKSDRLFDRWNTVVGPDVLGNPGYQRVHRLTSVRLPDRTAFYDESEILSDSYVFGPDFARQP